MDKLRLVYEQTGRARWISHLDAMRTLQRGLLRAGRSGGEQTGRRPEVRYDPGVAGR